MAKLNKNKFWWKKKEKRGTKNTVEEERHQRKQIWYNKKEKVRTKTLMTT